MSDKKLAPKQGYDAACHTREQDHLNRWPLAKEIYRIAVDGPDDWSVRVGIYGEWGSGKSSVLNFIEYMAQKDGHVVFHFNPWQYHSKDDLWKAFVDGLFKQIEEELGQPAKGKGQRTAKKVGVKIAATLPKIVKFWREDAGKAAEVGIGLLGRYLTFSSKDLDELNATLNGRRLLITIDDLDRTDGTLVPEILYALKEIMDVPRMAFICAFDPIVVGRVLGKAHPGHEDGLKFLEKIIDYPRWLPSPTDAQLLKLAQLEASKVCPFVPTEHLSETISALPRNPRSIRQFIRILALLKPQIERHHPWELQWPVILTANIFKVRFPQLAQRTLRDHDFWEKLYHATLFSEKKDEETKQIIDDYIDNLTDEIKDKYGKDIRSCIESITSKVDAWTGIYGPQLQYQFHLAESPHAVTWKEFDTFFASCSNLTEHEISQWVEKHAEAIEESPQRVIDELLTACISRRRQSLEKAANSTTKKELNAQMIEAQKSLTLIQIFLSKVSGKSLKAHYNAILDQFAEYFSWKNEPKYRVARQEEIKLIDNIFEMNSPDWKVWMDVIGLKRRHSSRDLDRPEWKNFESGLRDKLRMKAAEWLVESFSTTSDFLKSVFQNGDHANQYKSLFLDSQGPVWTTQKNKFLKQLKGKDPDLQHNCYKLLTSLIDSAEDGMESKQAKEILKDRNFTEKLWKQCLSNPLNPRMVGSLRISQNKLKNDYQIDCPVPKWWERTCEELDRKK